MKKTTASHSFFGTPAQAYQETTGENQSFDQQLSNADGSLENICVDFEQHMLEYFAGLTHLNFTYEYSCLLLTEFFPSFSILLLHGMLLTDTEVT